MYTQLYSSTSRTQNVHHFSYHLLMCPGFAVIYRKYMRGFVKPKRLNERGETCQAQMISLKVVWRFVVLSFSNSYLFYSPQQEFFYLSLCLRENTNHNHSEPLTDQCTLSFHCQTSACSPARENESPTYEHFEEMFTFV